MSRLVAAQTFEAILTLDARASLARRRSANWRRPSGREYQRGTGPFLRRGEAPGWNSPRGPSGRPAGRDHQPAPACT